MYEGLEIITNKMPVEERMGVRHHFLGSVSVCVGEEEGDGDGGEEMRVGVWERRVRVVVRQPFPGVGG